MSKDPAFLFYPSDFLTGTTFFTLEDLGLYIKLICIQHQHGGRIKKADFNSVVTEKFGRVREKFAEDESGFFNERLDYEMMKRKRDADSSRKNGLLGGRPKTKKPKDNLRVKKTKPKRNLTENENEDINVNGIVLREGVIGEGLTSLQVNGCIEFISITTKKDLTEEQVGEYWKAFLIHSEGHSYFRSNDQLKHFRTWLKIQIQNNGTDKTTTGSAESRIAALKKW